MHSRGTSLCSLDAKWSKDKHRHRLCSERGLKAPYQNIPAHALEPAWHVSYLRKLSVTGIPWDVAVGVSHRKRQPCVLGDTGGAVGAPTHVEGHSMGPTKLCLTEAASVSAAEVLMWALISAGAFLLLCTKIKDNWKIVKKNETRKKKKNLSWPLVAVRDKF